MAESSRNRDSSMIDSTLKTIQVISLDLFQSQQRQLDHPKPPFSDYEDDVFNDITLRKVNNNAFNTIDNNAKNDYFLKYL